MKRFVLIILLVFNFTFSAQVKDKNITPTLIEADKLKYDNKNALAIYKGNVIVKRGDFTLWADKMYIYFSKKKQDKKEDKSQLEKIEAIGNVRFKKGEYVGKSEKAEYYENGRYIKLIGKATLEKKGNKVEGDIITYYLDTEEAFVSGKNRVRTIIINENGGQ